MEDPKHGSYSRSYRNKVLCLRFPEQSALRWQASDCILLSGAMYVLTSHRHNLFADYSGAIAQIWKGTMKMDGAIECSLPRQQTAAVDSVNISMFHCFLRDDASHKELEILCFQWQSWGIDAGVQAQLVSFSSMYNGRLTGTASNKLSVRSHRTSGECVFNETKKTSPGCC